MRVVVSGGEGFIGSHTVERLAGLGHTVLVVDDQSHPCLHPSLPAVEQITADEASSEVADALASFRPDAVLHLAAKGGVAQAMRDPALHIGAVLAHTVQFLENAFAAGCRNLVIASSGGAAYGDPVVLPAHEQLTPAPRSAYGAEKCCEELYLSTLGVRGARTLALRYGNVYGPRQDGTGEAGVVPIAATRMAEGEPPVIYGDGMTTRDFVYVEDVVTANVAALTGNLSGAVNIGTGVEHSVRDIVGLLAQEFGFDGEPEFRAAREGEVRRVCLDTGLASEKLQFRAVMAVENGIRKTAQYFRMDQEQKRVATLESMK